MWVCTVSCDGLIFSCLAPSSPGTSSGSTMPPSRIKLLMKTTEGKTLLNRCLMKQWHIFHFPLSKAMGVQTFTVSFIIPHINSPNCFFRKDHDKYIFKKKVYQSNKISSTAGGLPMQKFLLTELRSNLVSVYQ